MDWRVLKGISDAALADRDHQEKLDAIKREQARQQRGQFESFLTNVANHPQMPDATKTTAMHAMLDTVTKGDKVDDKHYGKWADQLWRSTLRPAPYTQGEQTTTNMDQAAPGVGAGLNELAPGAGTMFESVMGNQASRIPTGTDRPQISGMLSPEEVAAGQGRAARIQMDAMTNGGDFGGGAGPGGGGGGGGAGSNIAALPNIKFDAKGRPTIGMTSRLIIPQQKNYSVGGKTVFGMFDPGSQRITDRTGNDITNKVDAIMGPGGVRWVQAADPDTGEPEWQALSRTAAPGTTGPKAPVRLSLLPTETATGGIGSLPTNSYTGRPAGPSIPRGQKTNAGVRREATVAGIESTRTGTAVKKGTYKATIDPNAFPEVPAPAGIPLVDTSTGQQPVGTRLFAATKEPGSVLQRASTGRVVVQHAEDTAKMVLDPQNAQFFGKVSGRISDLLTDGPSAFGYKFFGPVGTNDPRLTQLHGALKSISDLLTTVHGRRAEESARNFERSLGMVNSPAALAAIIRQYGKIANEVAGEGTRTVVPVSGSAPVSSRLPLTAPAAQNDATGAVTHRYVPGQGAVPVGNQ